MHLEGPTKHELAVGEGRVVHGVLLGEHAVRERLFVPELGILVVAAEEVGINFRQIEGFLELILLLVLDRAYFTLRSLDVSSPTRIVVDPIQITHTA